MISKVAILRALQLGDMLCAIPTVRAIRRSWPEARIFLIGLPWQKELLTRFSTYFDEFIEFPGWPGLPERTFDPDQILQFLHDIRKLEFDLVLQMQGNGESTNAMCMLWGARRVCGLRKPGEYAPDPALFPVSRDDEHEILRFFKLLNCIQIPPEGSYLEFPITDTENAIGLEMSKKLGVHSQPYVCIHPGARDIRRRWPAEHFVYVANELVGQGYHVVLTGSMDERDLLADIKQRIRGPVSDVVETCGHVSLGALAVILRDSRLLVSNDTGVSHIAAAIGLPSVIIFSPYSDIGRWRPLDAERHVAIPHTSANDPAYVVKRANEALRRSQERDHFADLHTSPIPGYPV